MKDNICSDYVNFACTIKFIKEYLTFNGHRTYCMGSLYGEYFTAGGVRNILIGKLQHPPYSFSFRCFLIIISASVFSQNFIEWNACSLLEELSLARNSGKLFIDIVKNTLRHKIKITFCCSNTNN
jgi:hypothetical protein